VTPCGVQTGDTSAYASSIAGVLNSWGPLLFRGLVSPDVDESGSLEDMAFEHVCTRTVSSFVRHLLTHGLLKYACTQLSLCDRCA
jgi:hypothetical protein